MSCPPDPATFRLLDALVGWEAVSTDGIVGADDLDGLTLQSTDLRANAETIALALPPAWLAKACDPCRWLMVGCNPSEARLLLLDHCSPGWRPLVADRCSTEVRGTATALAVHRDLIAISDPAASAIRIWRRNGEQFAFSIPVSQPGPIAWADGRGWLVADLDAMRLRCFDPSGAERPGALPLPGTADRIGVDHRHRIWLVTLDSGIYRIWCAEPGASAFAPATVAGLLAAFADTGLRQTAEKTFCIEDSVDGAPQRRCFDYQGHPVAAPATQTAPPAFVRQGQLLTAAIDSGIPRCRWHRLRIDADIPPGTMVGIAVSSHEEPDPAPQSAPLIQTGEWAGFASGLPNPDDWFTGATGALDVVIDQPPGRYLFVRLRLSGDGQRSPRVRRIRIDMPRQTSFDRLPAVFADNPVAVDFGERFLSLFDAAVEDMDAVIERYPALLDVDGVPQELLPWLGKFLGVTMDAAWAAGQRRAILKAVPELFRLRGTPEGLARAIELVLCARPLIDEPSLARPWGAAGSARLGNVRLFGRAATRFRIGSSGLGGAPLWSVGNPDLDPLTAQAFRFGVMLPAPANTVVRYQVDQMIASQKPAHTVASVRSGAAGLVIGVGLAIGIDTALVALPPSVIGRGDGIRLGRQSVLWSRHRTSAPSMRVGSASAVAIHTRME